VMSLLGHGLKFQSCYSVSSQRQNTLEGI
jgi:hypothetical protein